MVAPTWSPKLWQDDPVAGSPPHFTMSAHESVLLAFDPAHLLTEAQAPLNPGSELRRLDTGETQALADPPVVNQTGLITQRVTDLTRNVLYRLEVDFDTGDDRRAIVLYIRCI